MSRLFRAVALLPLVLPGSAPSGSAPAGPQVLDRLVGSWEGEGELFGRPATFSMTWSPVLAGEFLRLEYENRLVEADGSHRTVLEAFALYRVAEGERLRGTWFDTRGQVLELRAVATDSTLVTRWIGESEQGRTTYRVIDSGTVEVEDDVLEDKGWRRFGKATYRRVAP